MRPEPRLSAPLDVDSLTIGARELVVETVRWALTDAGAALGALMTAAAITVALAALRHLLLPRLQSQFAHLSGAGVGRIVRSVLSHAKDWFFLALGLELSSAWFDLPELVARGVGLFFTIAFTWQLAIWMRALVLALIEQRAAQRGEMGSLANALDVVRVLVSAVIFAIAATAILDNLGANVNGLIAGLGIGGIAIGLAAQGVVGDLFAALSILFDKPFIRGDPISFDGIDGEVEATGLKTTRIRATSGEEIVIGNASLLGKIIRNNARRQRRRVTLTLGLGYWTDAADAERVPDVLRSLMVGREHSRFVRAGLSNFGASSLEYQFVFDVHGLGFDDFVAERHAVLAALLKRFEDEGLSFAYPTQVQMIAGPDGRPIDPPQGCGEPTHSRARP
ncbi:MAG: mechanosensitive ion channel family protein [Sphingomonadaceae bacterium]|nr:mechanosensitive ion channel family protein [Sphingomonadaceae bacterium]